MNLNKRAYGLVEELVSHAHEYHVVVRTTEEGGRVIDCGADARGGLRAGVMLAKICLAGLADVSIIPGCVGERPIDYIQVVTDHPVRACLGSQYAGWAIQVEEGKFFAMGSGPMRAAYGHEKIYDTIGHREDAQHIVGVLETRQPVNPSVVALVARSCRVTPPDVTLLSAPTASLAGGVQVVARSVETALHKLAELGFDLDRVISATGSAPLPPVASNDLKAIGRTNDAVLYGARVILYVRGDDESIQKIGNSVPSSGSKDFGEPFLNIFSRYGNDFYKVDPMLFSPAEVAFQNVVTGKTHVFGRLATNVLERSFF